MERGRTRLPEPEIGLNVEPEKLAIDCVAESEEAENKAFGP